MPQATELSRAHSARFYPGFRKGFTEPGNRAIVYLISLAEQEKY